MPPELLARSGKVVTRVKLEVKEVLYAQPTEADGSGRREYLKKVDYLECQAVDGFSRGDKVVVFLVSYEGQYAVPRYGGTNCTLGFKVSRFDAPITKALRAEAAVPARSRRDVRSNHVAEWRSHDAVGVAKYEAERAASRGQDIPAENPVRPPE